MQTPFVKMNPTEFAAVLSILYLIHAAVSFQEMGGTVKLGMSSSAIINEYLRINASITLTKLFNSTNSENLRSTVHCAEAPIHVTLIINT